MKPMYKIFSSLGLAALLLGTPATAMAKSNFNFSVNLDCLYPRPAYYPPMYPPVFVAPVPPPIYYYPYPPYYHHRVVKEYYYPGYPCYPQPGYGRGLGASASTQQAPAQQQ